MSFKLDKNNENKSSLLPYTAGQFAFFDIEVYNDLKVQSDILLFHLLPLRIL